MQQDLCRHLSPLFWGPQYGRGCLATFPLPALATQQGLYSPVFSLLRGGSRYHIVLCNLKWKVWYFVVCSTQMVLQTIWAGRVARFYRAFEVLQGGQKPRTVAKRSFARHMLLFGYWTAFARLSPTIHHAHSPLNLRYSMECGPCCTDTCDRDLHKQLISRAGERSLGWKKFQKFILKFGVILESSYMSRHSKCFVSVGNQFW